MSGSINVLQNSASDAEITATTTAANTSTSPPTATARSDDVDSPANLLVRDARLEKLFEVYPSLRTRLKSIFDAATVDDGREEYLASRSHSPHQRIPQKIQKSPGKSIAGALRILERELDSDSADVSGIKAFAELVAGLNSNIPNPDSGENV